MSDPLISRLSVPNEQALPDDDRAAALKGGA